MRVTRKGGVTFSQKSGPGYEVTLSMDSVPLRRLNALLDTSDPRILVELQATAAEVTAAIQAHVQVATPVNLGSLRNSIASEVVTVSSTPVHVVGSVFTNMIYAVPVELGSRPHMPPQAPIYFWVQRKIHPPQADVARITNAVRWKIFRHGTKGRHMFSRGVLKAMPFVNRRISQAIERITALLGGS